MTATYYPPEVIERASKQLLDEIAADAAKVTDPGQIARYELKRRVAVPLVRWMMEQQNAGLPSEQMAIASASVIAWLLASIAGTLAGGDQQETIKAAGFMSGKIDQFVGEIIILARGTVVRPEVRN